MYIFTSTVCLAFHAVCFLALGDFSSVLNSATATPIPLPLSLMAADRSLSLISVNRTIPHIAGRNILSRPYIRTVKPSRHMKEHARRADELEELQNYYDLAKANSVKLSKRAVQVNTLEYSLTVNSESRRQIVYCSRRRPRFSARFYFSAIRIQYQYAGLSNSSCKSSV